jgi:hypothetical protein
MRTLEYAKSSQNSRPAVDTQMSLVDHDKTQLGILLDLMLVKPLVLRWGFLLVEGLDE